MIDNPGKFSSGYLLSSGLAFARTLSPKIGIGSCSLLNF